MQRDARILLVAVAAFGLAACGGGGGGAADADLTVDAVSGLDFEPIQVTADAGEMTIALNNEDSQRHTFVIDDPQFKVDARAGNTSTGTVTLEPGTYTFYCDVTGHRQAGMEGTLEVE